MDTPKQISKLLNLATHALSETGPLYKEVPGLSREKSLKSLGSALTQIFDIKESLSAIHPELESDQWKLINQNEAAFKAEGELMQKAEAAEQAGNLQLAKQLYQQIESGSQVNDYRIYAQAGLYRVLTKES